MGNIVLKEDGFTPIVKATDENKVPATYMKLAQSYVDKVANQAEVRKSRWRYALVIARETGDTGGFVLLCGFDVLLPHHPIEYTGIVPAFGHNTVDFSRQIAEIRSWLLIIGDIRMMVGTCKEYLIWIELVLPPYDPREDTIRAQDAEIKRLEEMLYWSPQGEGFQQTQTHFQETAKNLH